jgi:hypothetical protein
VVKLLEPIEAKEKTPVEVIFKEETEAKDGSILQFIGIWEDMSPEEIEVMENITKDRKNFFAINPSDL